MIDRITGKQRAAKYGITSANPTKPSASASWVSS
jgi:hypothetical protein